jgi:hypothetical protein
LPLPPVPVWYITRCTGWAVRLIPEYCCTVRRFSAPAGTGRGIVELGCDRLRVVRERDHGGEHVVAIVAAFGAQSILHAATLAIDQQPRALGFRVFVVDDGHEGQRVRQRRDLQRIGIEGVRMPAQMRRCAFEHIGDPAGVLGRDAPFAAIGLPRRQRRPGFLAGSDELLQFLDAASTRSSGIAVDRLQFLCRGLAGRDGAGFRRRHLEIIGFQLDQVADLLADQMRQRFAAGEVPMRAGPGQHLPGGDVVFLPHQEIAAEIGDQALAVVDVGLI